MDMTCRSTVTGLPRFGAMTSGAACATSADAEAAAAAAAIANIRAIFTPLDDFIDL